MNFLMFLAFLGLLAGMFLCFGISPLSFAERIAKPFANRTKPIAKQIEEIQHPKEPKGFRQIVRDARVVLDLTGKSGKFSALCAVSFFLLVVGTLLSVLVGNYFLLPILAVGMALLPFWYILFTSHSYRKQMNNEIETALSVITTSYLRSESIISAIEENLDYLNPPVADVFTGFLAQVNLISTDVKKALADMKPKLKNNVFSEWVDAVIACQDDMTLKSTLTPIISKLSDMRIVSAELDYLMYEPLKEFITMALLLLGNIPLLYFLNRDWYGVLVGTDLGKGILAVCVLVLFISLSAVIRLTKPVEYRR